MDVITNDNGGCENFHRSGKAEISSVFWRLLILASLTRRYRFEPGPGPDPEPTRSRPGADPEPTSRLTIRSLDGISLRVWKRPKVKHEQTIPDEPEEAPVEAAKCPFH